MVEKGEECACLCRQKLLHYRKLKYHDNPVENARNRAPRGGGSPTGPSRGARQGEQPMPPCATHPLRQSRPTGLSRKNLGTNWAKLLDESNFLQYLCNEISNPTFNLFQKTSEINNIFGCMFSILL